MAGWFAAIRHLVVFGLGVWIIVDALSGTVSVVPKLLIGMVMVGVLPIENLTLTRPVTIRSKERIDRACKRGLESKSEATD